jgi:LCP family protein required for cell wall assembly
MSMRSSTSRATALRLIPLIALLIAGLAGATGERRAAAQDAVQPDDLGTLTIVVGGLDTRSPDQPENTDVLIIARIDVPNRTVRAVPIPRDLYVEIPGVGYDKITRAYDFGSKAAAGEADGGIGAGMALVEATVSLNFGIPVDGAVLTTFDGFVAIIDALGGIDVVNPYDLYDAEYPTLDYGIKEIYYPAGPLHLTGEQALEFVRTRHQDSDDGRTMRQQLVLRAMLERVLDPAIAPNLPELVETTRNAVRTDLTLSTQLALALAAPGFSDENVSFASVMPYVWADTAPGGMWIYNADWSVLPGIVQAALNGAA